MASSSSSSVGNQKDKLFIGTFIHSKKLDELEYLHDTAVCVDRSGRIVAVEPQCDRRKAEEVLYPRLGWRAPDVDVLVAEDGQFFFPGFIGKCGPAPLPQIATSARSRPEPALTYHAPRHHRHARARAPIPERGHLRQIDAAGLAEHVHVPDGGVHVGSRQGAAGVRPVHPPDAGARHDRGRLLRHRRRGGHQPAGGPLPGTRPARPRRPRLHGPPPPPAPASSTSAAPTRAPPPPRRSSSPC